jgi:hypothetical protein
VANIDDPILPHRLGPYVQIPVPSHPGPDPAQQPTHDIARAAAAAAAAAVAAAAAQPDPAAVAAAAAAVGSPAFRAAPPPAPLAPARSSGEVSREGQAWKPGRPSPLSRVTAAKPQFLDRSSFEVLMLPDDSLTRSIDAIGFTHAGTACVALDATGGEGGRGRGGRGFAGLGALGRMGAWPHGCGVGMAPGWRGRLPDRGAPRLGGAGTHRIWRLGPAPGAPPPPDGMPPQAPDAWALLTSADEMVGGRLASPSRPPPPAACAGARHTA